MTVRWSVSRDDFQGTTVHHGLGEFAEYRVEFDRELQLWRARRLLEGRGAKSIYATFANVENAKAYVESVERRSAIR